MALFAVKREIDGKSFLKDEDRIIADNWEAAEIIIMQGTLQVDMMKPVYWMVR